MAWRPHTVEKLTVAKEASVLVTTPESVEESFE
jgi:hypothetical protein